MASKGAPTGLFAKMAQFMGAAKDEARAPADSEQSVQSGDSELEKQQLQARIEGKRRDDQIRRMEFNHLRKLRGHDKLALGAMPKASGYEDSSGYAEALPSSAKRERTVSKINAIEAHLSDHWAQRRRADAAGQNVPVPGATPPQASNKPATLQPPAPAEVIANAPPLPAASSEVMDSEMDLDFTSYLASDPVQKQPEAPVSAIRQAETAAVAKVASPVFKDSGNSSFSDSRIESVELGQGIDNPALQEAAIRFADGDVQGAEALLLAAMQDPVALAEVAETCAAAVLDLYRASDQAAAFDVVAIEFAQRFGRSAPEWYSVPSLLELHKSTAVPREHMPLTEWQCPQVLDTRAVAQLRDVQQQSVERHVQWERLEKIEAEAVVHLHALFTDWAAKPLAVSSRGHTVLNGVLETATPNGDATVDPQWWMCRLECLRIQGLHEAYENVALDYCVTYEVSPPSWVEADCTFTSAREPQDGPDSITGPDSVYSTFGDTRAPQTLELSGEILGDALDVMRSLSERVHPGEDIVISCARLIRIDFAAAGSLLNWLSARSPREGAVEFVNVPRLVATFLTVMGVTQHARVVTRLR